MTSCRNKTSPEASSEQERRFLSNYGKLPARVHLLQDQLENRKYFDSGDFALSAAKTASDMGSVQTDTQHPSRLLISHPSSPVPSGSNVSSSANPQQQGEGSVGNLREKSHLHGMMNEDTMEFGSTHGLQSTRKIEMFTSQEYLTERHINVRLDILRMNEDIQGYALPASKLIEHLKNKDPVFKEYLMDNDNEKRRAIEWELRRKMVAKGVVTDD